MARRKNALGALFFGLVVIGCIIGLIGTVLDSFGEVKSIILIVLVIGGVAFLQYVQKKKRIQYLLDKYGDEQIVERIMNKNFW